MASIAYSTPITKGKLYGNFKEWKVTCERNPTDPGPYKENQVFPMNGLNSTRYIDWRNAAKARAAAKGGRLPSRDEMERYFKPREIGNIEGEKF